MEKLLLALQIAAAAADAAARARALYDKLHEQAQRDHELTPEQSAELQRRAEAIFAAPASQPSGR